MYGRIEAAARCTTCREVTPVNAVVGALACDGCGAEVVLRDALWDMAFAEVGEVLRELVDNERRRLSWSQGSGELGATVARAQPTCPHCEAQWSEAPTVGMDCPGCGQSIAVRQRPGLWLVGEDRTSLAGERGRVAPEVVRCPSCAAPVRVDGSSRTPDCGSCGGQVMVPDELWRRVHAPTAVAPWFVWTAGERASGLPESLHATELAAVGDVLACVGSISGYEAGLFVLTTEPLGLAWSVDLSEHGYEFSPQMGVAGDEILVFELYGDTAHRFAVADGAFRGRVSFPEGLIELAGDPDGTLVARTHPYDALRRFGQDGELRWLWTPPGFFGRMLGSKPQLGHVVPASPPSSRADALMAGRIAMGQDGELRAVAADAVARFARDGTVRWCVRTGGGVSIVAPGAAPDGTTWVVIAGDEGGQFVNQLLRVAADGVDLRVVERGGNDTALAVSADGSVWLSGVGGLRRLDAEGNLLWRQSGS